MCSLSQWDRSSFESEHAILDKKEYPLSETLDRLVRLASELKVYRASLPPSGSLKSGGDYLGVSKELYGKIFSVEYSDMKARNRETTSDAAGAAGSARTKLRLQRSFTVLDWKLLRRLTD